MTRSRAVDAGAHRRDVVLTVWDTEGRRQLTRDGQCLRVTMTGLPADHPARLVDAVAVQTGLRVAVLRVTSAGTAEVERLGGEPAPGARWQPAIMDPPVDVRPAWQRPGWLRSTTYAVDRELARLGLHRTGHPVQVRHTVVTGMLRIPVGRSSVWLKAGLPLFRREATVIRWLAALGPYAVVPTVLAEGDGWWLAAPFARTGLVPAEDSLAALVRLQAAAAGRVDELRTLGCPDRGLDTLVGEVGALTERPDLVVTEDRRRLREILPRLAEVASSASGLLPPTIVHGDFHAGNVRWTSVGWLLYDWTDACVSHPLTDLTMGVWDDPPARATVRAGRYAQRWAEVTPGLDVEKLLRVAPVVGAAFQAANYRSIITAALPTSLSGRRVVAEPTAAELLDLLHHWVRRLVELLGADDPDARRDRRLPAWPLP